MKCFVISLALVVCGTWSIEASAQVLWQIGTFDGPPTSDSNLEFHGVESALCVSLTPLASDICELQKTWQLLNRFSLMSIP